MPYELTVRVHRRANLLSPDVEMTQYIGYNILQTLFVREQVDPSIKRVHLFFPERWLNITQERSIFMRLEQFCPNLEKVEIDTGSVYIIQCVSNKNMQIIVSQEERDYVDLYGLPQESASGISSFRVPGTISASGLNVLNGGVYGQ